MNLHQVLFFCFFSALCGGDSGLVSAKVGIFTGSEGGNGSFACYFSSHGNKKFFCKGNCEAENILIKTEDVSAQNGRFSAKYKIESETRSTLTVAITNLSRSDAGLYMSGLGTDLVPERYCDFLVRISDEPLDDNSRFHRSDVEGEVITFGCLDTVHQKHKFLCRDQCEREEDIIIETDENSAQSGRFSIEYKEGSTFGLYVTITNVSRSDTGYYRCGYGRPLSPDSFYKQAILVIHDPFKPTSTPPPPSTSASTVSIPTTQSFSSSSAFSTTINQPSPTVERTRTPRPLSTSVSSASTTTTQSLISGSGTFVSSDFAGTNNRPEGCSVLPHPGYISAVAVLLLVVFLLMLYMWRMRRRSGHLELPVSFKNSAAASTCDDSTHKNGSGVVVLNVGSAGCKTQGEQCARL